MKTQEGRPTKGKIDLSTADEYKTQFTFILDAFKSKYHELLQASPKEKPSRIAALLLPIYYTK